MRNKTTTKAEWNRNQIKRTRCSHRLHAKDFSKRIRFDRTTQRLMISSFVFRLRNKSSLARAVMSWIGICLFLAHHFVHLTICFLHLFSSRNEWNCDMFLYYVRVDGFHFVAQKKTTENRIREEDEMNLLNGSEITMREKIKCKNVELLFANCI